MDIQRLRNLTTGKLHTDVRHVYEDIEYLVGEKGLVTHLIPAAIRALAPYLKEQVTDQRFWDETHDQTHTGEVDIRPMTDEEKEAFWNRFEIL